MFYILDIGASGKRLPRPLFVGPAINEFEGVSSIANIESLSEIRKNFA